MPEENEFLVGSDGNFAEGWRDTLPEEIRESKAFEGVENFSSLATGYEKLKSAPPPEDPPKSLMDAEGNLSEDWMEKVLGDELKDNQSLKQFTSLPAIAKTIVNQNKIVGRKEFDWSKASDEEKAAVRVSMGVPAEADGYAFEVPDGVPEGMDYDLERDKAFAAKAHELGMTADQAQGLRGWFNEGDFSAHNKAYSDSKIEYDKSESDLRTEYGAAYDEKVALANRVVDTMGVGESLKKLGLANHPEIIKSFVKVGGFISEDRLVGESTSTSGAMTPAEAKAEVDKMMGEKDSPLMDEDHPEHAAYAKRKNDLYKMIYK